jgi:hypothetical protein
MRKKSPTPDEISHDIPSGYVFLKKFDLRFDTHAPPLARYIIAAPLLFMDINLPDNKNFWRREDRAEFGKDFLYAVNKYPDKIVFVSRMMVLLVATLGGLLLFIWTKQIYSVNEALIALLFYVFSPEILAHARLATTDMIATVFILLSLYAFWRFFENSNLKTAIFCGFSIGLAFLSKYSAVLLIPLFVFFALKRIFSAERMFSTKNIQKARLFGLILVLILTIFLTMWLSYGFEFKPILQDTMRAEEKVAIFKNFCACIPFLKNSDLSNNAEWYLNNIPIPLGSYILGVLGVARHGAMGHTTFFLGKWSGYGHPLYYIVAFLIKTPLPLILMLLVAILELLRRKKSLLEWYLLSIAALFFVIASLSKLQLGLRYILPIYPICFIIASKPLADVLRKHSSFKLIGALVIVWYIISSIVIWPDYLSYFNEIVGGPKNGWRYLRDSNIDWGEDLPALSEYMKRNGIDKIKLLYFGSADPKFYNIDYEDITEPERLKPANNVYAISLHYIDAVEWAKDRSPDAMAGYSIYIYDFRDKKSPHESR